MKPVLLCALLALGCGKKREKQADPGVPPVRDAALAARDAVAADDASAAATTPRPVFPRADVVSAPASPPARYAAALPRSQQDIDAWLAGDPRFPPRERVTLLLCEGDDVTWDKVVDAATHGATRSWAELTPCACSRAADRLPAAKGKARELWLWAAVDCDDQGLDALYLGAGSDALVVRRFGLRSEMQRDPRVTAAERRQVLLGGEFAEEALEAQAGTHLPLAADFILDLYQRAGKGPLRGDFLYALAAFPDHPGASALLDKEGGCTGASDDDRWCKRFDGGAPWQRPVSDLIKCAADGCLRELARRDRGAATQVARGLQAKTPDDAVLARTLLGFDSPGSLHFWMARHGLIGEHDFTGKDSLTVLDSLEGAGRSAQPEDDPVAIQAALAKLTASVLRDAILTVEDGAPVAYAEGARFTVESGDAIGLVNHLLEQRGSALRCLALARADRHVRLACAEPRGIQAALAQGLLVLRQ